MNDPEPWAPEMRRQLAAASQLLESGRIDAARDLGIAVLKAAQAQGDRSMQGQALLALSQFDRVVGRFRRAIDTAQSAVQLFQLGGDIAGEASALSLVAHSSSILGRNEESVEAALLSVKLGDLRPPGPQQVILQNYLGVAYLWSKSFDHAETALREAERLALLYAPDSNVLLPRTNLAWLEAMRLFNERYFTGTIPSIEPLQQRLAACAGLFDESTPFHGLPGVRAVLQRFGRLTSALCLCWAGDPDAAQEQLDAAQDRSNPGHYAQVADAIIHWVRAEQKWAQNDLEGAQQAAATLIEEAGQAEFEQMVFIGHLLLTQIFVAQGHHALALKEERSHRRRQFRVRSDRLEARLRVVQTQLDIRASERHLQQLALHSQEMERLSFEDSLTAIANRRHVEKRLGALLDTGPGPAQPFCAALIDLDHFKSINDNHSHATGDDVLKAVAQAISASVRESDLPARLGGDEFVILFPNTTIDQARQICDRVLATVSGLRWEQFSPPLKVSVSIGLTQAQSGDDVATILRRSDTAMYEAKARSPVSS